MYMKGGLCDSEGYTWFRISVILLSAALFSQIYYYSELESEQTNRSCTNRGRCRL